MDSHYEIFNVEFGGLYRFACRLTCTRLANGAVHIHPSPLGFRIQESGSAIAFASRLVRNF